LTHRCRPDATGARSRQPIKGGSGASYGSSDSQSSENESEEEEGSSVDLSDGEVDDVKRRQRDIRTWSVEELRDTLEHHNKIRTVDQFLTCTDTDSDAFLVASARNRSSRYLP